MAWSLNATLSHPHRPQENVLTYVINLKKKDGSLEPLPNVTKEDHYINFVKMIAGPGTVVVDAAIKADEARSLKALEVAAELGCSLVMPFSRPAEYKSHCTKLFGDARITTFQKNPTPRRLLHSLIDSHLQNPARTVPISRGYREEAMKVSYPSGYPPKDEARDEADEDCGGCGHDHGHAHGGHGHSHDHGGARGGRDRAVERGGHGGPNHHHHEDGTCCDHDHGEVDEEAERKNKEAFDKLVRFMEIVHQKPKSAIDAVMKGSATFSNALASLCSAPILDLPETLHTLPDGTPIPLDDPKLSSSAFSRYFASQGALTDLLSAVKTMSESIDPTTKTHDGGGMVRLEGIPTPVPKIVIPLCSIHAILSHAGEGEGGAAVRKGFLEDGGVEVLRMNGEVVLAPGMQGGVSGGVVRGVPGAMLVRSSDSTVAYWSKRIMAALAVSGDEGGAWRVLCDGCGKREGRQEEWRRCARCNWNAYCSKECQVSDWKTHKPVCMKIN
ncbi:hypothetical protein HDU67_009161 [Dinochytrium kinnereticum]|nr:hypothetical protein HDU67_009161 [Dinochytrium kinnereticum]